MRIPPQVMELAHLGEARTGSQCGRMDQCCALGTNHVAAMFFDGEDVRIYEVRPCLLAGQLHIVVFPQRRRGGLVVLASTAQLFVPGWP